MQTLLKAADLFQSGPRGELRIFVLDLVNPLPFMLGYRPPRGGNLWFRPETPSRPAPEVFDDVDVVLVPKYSTDAPSTIFGLTAYGAYLAERFPQREETRSWVVLTRPAVAGPSPVTPRANR